MPDWVWPALGALIALAGLYFGRRKENKQDKEEDVSKAVKEATERTEVKEALKRQEDKLDGMDRNINDKLSRMEGQYAGMNTCQQDHEQRLVRVEESAKSAHKRIDELKAREE